MTGLARKLFYFWRVLATGIAFATFMIGGLFMALTFFPVARIWPGTPEEKGTRIRGMIQFSFYSFIRFMASLGIMGMAKVEGLENIRRAGPCLVIANHPTLIDVVLLVSLIKDCNCVVKRALWMHPFMGPVIRGANYIPNDNGPELVQSCQAGFKEGRPLIIFPEGTRSPENDLHTFNRGATQIALRANVPVVRAVITCTPPTLMSHQRWYHIPSRPFQLTLKFHPAMTVPEEILQKEELPQQVRALTRHFEAFYRKELSLER